MPRPQRGGEIFKYYTFGNPNVGGKETRSYTVSNLSGGVPYCFVVRAGNGCMPGDFSNELKAVPLGGKREGVLGTKTKEEKVISEATEAAEKPTPTKSSELPVLTQEKERGKILLLVGVSSALAIFGFWLWRLKFSD